MRGLDFVGFVFRIVRTWGKLDSLGYNAENVADGGLNSPYDAKAVGDYTGLTPPF